MYETSVTRISRVKLNLALNSFTCHCLTNHLTMLFYFSNPLAYGYYKWTNNCHASPDLRQLLPYVICAIAYALYSMCALCVWLSTILCVKSETTRFLSAYLSQSVYMAVYKLLFVVIQKLLLIDWWGHVRLEVNYWSCLLFYPMLFSVNPSFHLENFIAQEWPCNLARLYFCKDIFAFLAYVVDTYVYC